LLKSKLFDPFYWDHTLKDDTIAQAFNTKKDFNKKQRRVGESYIQYTTDQMEFKWFDTFNVIMGLLEGAMAAIPSNTNSYYCSLNTTEARGNTKSMIEYYQLGKDYYSDSMENLYYLLSKTGFIWQDCYLSY